MFQSHDNVEKVEIQPGVMLQRLGKGANISAVHWNFTDGAVVDLHHHVQEQFGYVINGALEVTIGDETRTLRAGDWYFIPSEIPHRFVAVGVTEAIDVFTPVREVAGGDYRRSS